MAVYHVKPGGTKTTGASTADDWTDSNCYPDIDDIASTTVGNGLLGGDEIILDGGATAGAAVTHTFNHQQRFDQINSAVSITVKSRYGVADGCIIDFSHVTASDIQVNPSAAATVIFEDFTYTKSVTHTDNNSPNWHIEQECAAVTFTRITFKDVTTFNVANTKGLSQFILSRLNGTQTTRTVTFNSCTWDNIDLEYGNGSFGCQIQGTGGDTQTVNFNGTNTVKDCSQTAANVTASSTISGWFFFQSGVTVNNNGTLKCLNYLSTQALTDDNHYGFIYTEGTFNSTGIVEGNNVVITGGRSRCALLHCNGTYTINEVISTDCQSIWGDTTNGSSSAGFLTQTAGTGTIAKITATNPKARFGAACYNSGGASIDAGVIICTGAVTYQGAVYSGGDGDFEADCIFIANTRFTDDLNAGESISTTGGLDFFSHLNEATGVRAKTTDVRQMTIIGGNTSAPSSARVRNAHTTFTHTVNMTNVAFDSGNSTELDLVEGASSTLDVTLLNCAYGAASEIDQTSYSGSGTFINTNPIVSLALGISSDGNVTGAPLAGAGNKWWTSPVPVDKDGEEFMDPPAIGADANYGSGYLPSVDFNSVSPQRLRRLRNARQRQF